jgi:phage protein D
MALPYKPKAIIKVDEVDISDNLELVGYVLTVDDNIGFDNDRLALTISSDKYIPIVSEKSNIEVTLGYEDNGGENSRFLGKFKLAEYDINLDRSGGRTINIVGSAIEYGAENLDSHNSRVWEDKLFRNIVSNIANNYNLSFDIDPTLAIETINYEVQDSSDQIFLSKLCKRFDAYMKIFDNKIYIYKRGNQLNKNGTLPEIVLYGALGINDNVIISSNRGKSFLKTYTGIEVQYKSGDSVETITRGQSADAKHVLKLPYIYDNAALAAQIARSKSAQLGRLNEVITFDVYGNPFLQSGAIIEVKEYDKDFDGRYFIDSCVHNFSKSYTCRLTCSVLEPTSGRVI